MPKVFPGHFGRSACLERQGPLSISIAKLKPYGNCTFGQGSAQGEARIAATPSNIEAFARSADGEPSEERLPEEDEALRRLPPRPTACELDAMEGRGGGVCVRKRSVLVEEKRHFELRFADERDVLGICRYIPSFDPPREVDR